MPCIEVSLPKINQETRGALAAGLTEAFCSSTGHPAEIFGLRFFEFSDKFTYFYHCNLAISISLVSNQMSFRIFPNYNSGPIRLFI